MLLSPAYAAESGASDSTADAAVATAAEAQSVKLVKQHDLRQSKELRQRPMCPQKLL